MIAITIILLIAILNPRIARAGVIIEQRITVCAPGAHRSVRTRTLMLQDDKEKFQVDDHVSVVIDATDRTVTVLDHGHKTLPRIAVQNSKRLNPESEPSSECAFQEHRQNTRAAGIQVPGLYRRKIQRTSHGGDDRLLLYRRGGFR